MIPYAAKIGKGTSCAHGGIGVVVHENVEIGENCVLGFGAKIVGRGPYKYVAKIGNRVWIGPGAVISGPVIIEDDVIIAANAVLTKSVSKGCIVAGIPAKIIGHVDDLDYDIFKNSSYDERIEEFLTDSKKIL